MSTIIKSDFPFAITSDKGFEIVISRDGIPFSSTVHVDTTKAKIKKIAINSIKEYLKIHNGRGDWVAEVYEAHLNSQTDIHTGFTSHEWVRTNEDPFFTF